MRLMLSRHDGHGMEFGQECCPRAVVRPAQVIKRVAVFHRCRPPGENVRIALHEGVGVFAFNTIHQGGVAVQMVEIFEKPEAIYLRQVRIRLTFRHTGGDLDGDLLEPDGGFERGLVRRVQPVHQGLLMLFDAAHLRQGTLQGAVHARTGVREAERFRFNTIHQNHPHPREGIIIQLTIGRLHEFLPREALLLQRDPFGLQ
jgi:hypothetical protein